MEVIVMRISARNVLPGTITSVTKGAVNAEVTLSLRGGETIVSIITNPSVDALELQVGKKVFGIIKATDVMVGKNLEGAKLSARNVLHGKAADLKDGAVNSEVGIRLPGGTAIVASITKASVEALDLKQGDDVSAIVKASHVLLGI
jgi:molybdate transport system regulatory protein